MASNYGVPAHSPTRLVVVRHGETEWNAVGRLMNQLDSPLTARGHAQAEAVARRLEAFPAEALYSSDLGRARSTAQLITDRRGGEAILHPGLRERHLGVFAGRTREEARAAFPAEYDRYRRDPEFVVPEGESFRQFYDRTIATFEEIAAAHSGGTVLVVTHAGCLDGLFRRVCGMPLDVRRAVRLPNTGLNIFEFEDREGDGQWTLVTWGDVSHHETP